MTWVTDDSYDVNIGEEVQKEPNGVLSIVNEPNCVNPGESWTAEVRVTNRGDATGTFQVEIDGNYTGKFDLSPGQTAKIEVRGTGPIDLTATLWLFWSGKKVKDDSDRFIIPRCG